MDSFCVSIGQEASLLGICTKPLRRWDESGSFQADFRTKGNHRRYEKSRVLTILRKRRKASKSIKCAVYGRVSSSRQKTSGDLERQIQVLKE